MSARRSSSRRSQAASSVMSAVSQKRIEAAQAEIEIANMELEAMAKIERKKEDISLLMKNAKKVEHLLAAYKNLNVSDLQPDQKEEYDRFVEELTEIKNFIQSVQGEIADITKSLEVKINAVKSRVQASAIVIDEMDAADRNIDVIEEEKSHARDHQMVEDWVQSLPFPANDEQVVNHVQSMYESANDRQAQPKTMEWTRTEFNDGVINQKLVNFTKEPPPKEVKVGIRSEAGYGEYSPPPSIPPPINEWNLNSNAPVMNPQSYQYVPVGRGQAYGPPRPPHSFNCQPYQYSQNYQPPRNSEMEDKLVQLLDTQLKLMSSAASNPLTNGTREIVVKSGIDKDLPKFSGDPGQFNNFKAAYHRSTKKYKFDGDENMMRMEKALKGDARTKVLHLMSNPLNLDKLMDTLEKTYGRPEFVLDYLVEKVKACEKVQFNKPETLVAFGDSVEALWTNVISYDKNEYMYNKQLTKDLIEKLPNQLQERWFEWRAENNARETNLRYFHNWLKQRVDAARLRVTPTVKLGIDVDESSGNRRSKRGSATVHVASSDETSKRSCANCKKTGHSTAKCWKFAKKSLEEKWQLVKDEKLCFLCLGPGHRTSDCKTNIKCSVDGCEKKHHSILHNNNGGSRRGRPTPSVSVDEDVENIQVNIFSNSKGKQIPLSSDNESVEECKNEDTTATTATSIVEGTDGALPIIPVYLKGPKGEVKTYALLDTGASRSLIEEGLATELGLEGRKIEFRARGFGGHLTTIDNAKSVSVEICGNYRGASYSRIDKVVTVSQIGVAPYSLNLEEAKKKWPCLRRIRGKSMKNVVPRIIVGTTHRHLTIPREILCSKLDGPVATRTILGWVLEGDLNGSGNGTFYFLSSQMDELDLTLHNLIKENFKVDDFGIVPEKSRHSMEDKKALKIMEQSTKKVNGVWETGLLWRDPNVKLPNSYEQAYQRLLGIERRMQKDLTFRENYMKKIEEYKIKNYIRKLPPNEANMRCNKTLYIPHFGVTNPNKPGKFRLVFDAASKAQGVSLNDCLLTGPDLLRSLTSVLWNFRRHRIVISGDIEDMFHRIRIRKDDQCSQRFLWRDGNQQSVPDTYEMEVMIFGATSSPSSAIFVKNKNAGQYYDEYPQAVTAIQDDFYMDDCLTGGEAESEVIKVREDITFINKEGGFVIKKWISNSTAVMDSIPEDLRLEGSRSIQDYPATEASERVLGLWWDPKSDVFTFKCNFHKVKKDILQGRQPTKREICSLVMSLYDPLGFIGHYRVKGMMILQRVWTSGIGWDDEIPEDIYEDWLLWLNDIQNITKVRVPRYYGPSGCDGVSMELHTFVDASKEAFAAICYFRIVSCKDTVVSFVASKVKVAPLKKLTIPKLELQAAVLGARLAASLHHEIKVTISQCYFWSDSRTVLSWIRSPSARHPEFIGNRVGAIQEISDPSNWRWVPTAQNTADDATRMSKQTEFDPTSRWFKGPSFLQEDSSNWPTEPKPYDDDEELVLGDAFGVSFSGSEKPRVTEGELDTIIPQLQKFSSYTKLVRVVATVMRLCKKWLAKVRMSKSNKSFDDHPLFEIVDGNKLSSVTPEEINEAEIQLIKWMQKDVYLSNNNQLKSKHLKKLCPYVDQFGVLRARGRIDRSETLDDTRRPIILPTQHKLTDLIVDREHKRNAHTGHETVLNNLRKKFWIIHGRQAVRRCWTRCNYCRIVRAKPVIPEMGMLPSFRLQPGLYPFTYTGVDYFGPVEVTVGRRHEKRWGVLFTCMVTRAVHLEVAHGLSSDETILALSRFVDVRRRPHTMFSDNGTNFHGAIKELQRAIANEDYKHMMEEVGLQEIQWRFIPPAAAHMGGAWERLIQAVKKVLKNILHDRFPKDTVLLTVMKAAENIVNSRPLTYLSNDVDDPSPLTPNHLIKCGVDIGPSIPADVESRDRVFREKWKEAQAYANLFWKRWTTEYLPSLLRREKWTDQVEPLEVGDLVIIVDDQQPRNYWIKAVVTRTFPAADGQVRSVEVTTRNFKTKKKTTLRRPVTKVCPLGLRMGKSAVMSSNLGVGNVEK